MSYCENNYIYAQTSTRRTGTRRHTYIVAFIGTWWKTHILEKNAGTLMSVNMTLPWVDQKQGETASLILKLR